MQFFLIGEGVWVCNPVEFKILLNFRLVAPQERHDAPIDEKFSMKERTVSLLLR